MGLCGGSRDVAAVTEGAPGTRGVGWLCRASGPPSGAELPRPPRVPSFPGPGWCRERPRHAVPSWSCLGGAGVQGPALTHTAWPWSCRRAHGSSSEVRFGAGKSRVSAARKPRLSHVVIGGGPPGAHPRGVPCPFCSSAYRVTYTVPSVPGALPFHLLLPHARPLHIVPQASEASQAASPPHADSGGPQALGSLRLRRRASRGGAGRALFATPFPQSPPSQYQS